MYWRSWLAVGAVACSCGTESDVVTESKTRSLEIEGADPGEEEGPPSPDTGEGVREFPPPTIEIRTLERQQQILDQEKTRRDEQESLATWFADFRDPADTTFVLASFVSELSSTGSSHRSRWRVETSLDGPSLPSEFTLVQNAENGELGPCDSVRGVSGRVDLLILQANGQDDYRVKRSGSKLGFAQKSGPATFQWEGGPFFDEADVAAEVGQW